MIDILGCWYSNNQAHAKILDASLASLKRANDRTSGRVAVLTCTWRRIPGNPFIEILAHHQMPNHLGIALQIANLIFHAQEALARPVLVSFLEHDVLYPHDYFTRILEALEQQPLAAGFNNQDYIGLNETGWLRVTQRQDPLHQLSMRYQAATDHLADVIRGCVMKGAVALEPANARAYLTLPAGFRPAVHINHSKNFTSHFSTFERLSTQGENHPYWGNFRDYYPDGEHQINTD